MRLSFGCQKNKFSLAFQALALLRKGRVKYQNLSRPVNSQNKLFQIFFRTAPFAPQKPEGLVAQKDD
jgi:hypothetical protein